MITTSEEYKEAVKAETEEDKFYADFGFTPEGAIEGATITSTNESELSKLSQINNGINTMSVKYSTCEPGRVLLDGTFYDLDLDNTENIGYISENMCDENGNFIDEANFTYVLDTTYDLVGVMLFFDDLGGEYATEGRIEYYNSSNVKLGEYTFTNNKTLAIVDFPKIGVKYIKVYITKWNIGYRFAKVIGFIPGQIFIFDDDNTYEFNLKEEINPFECSITIPEFSLTFDNTSKKFDIINPSGLISYLQQKMKVNAKIGIKTLNGIEYVNCGNFFLYSYPQETDEDVAQFICKPSMAFKTDYYHNLSKGTQTVEQAAAIIMAGETYTIDNDLKSIVVNQYIGREVLKVDAMGQLAVACGGYWKFNRDGSYDLKEFVIPASTDTIDYDNMWTKPNIKQSEYVTSVNCKYYAYNSTYRNVESTDNIVAKTTDDGKRIDINSVFIPTKARADVIGQLVLDYYDYRLRHSVDHRGDMSIEVGDTVEVENDYAMTDVFVTSHNITYDENNKLSARLEGIS